MRSVQQQEPPSIRGTARDNNCGSMRAVAADWLAVPSGELLRAAEVSHALILADPAQGADSRVAVHHRAVPPAKDRQTVVVLILLMQANNGCGRMASTVDTEDD
jgi:hypothetical protein